ncbi:uncharacterized protein LOC109504052 [Harpegnathos saltator]|uniref:uncharacterized protein LOC109504052 n=1 Tax=Harpegnathos saltator TaxID=610380 RepID=UPI000948FD8A|nr:uncharacterized protein LOC109504052 [Harpegnathos saltator]
MDVSERISIYFTTASPWNQKPVSKVVIKNVNWHGDSLTDTTDVIIVNSVTWEGCCRNLEHKHYRKNKHAAFRQQQRIISAKCAESAEAVFDLELVFKFYQIIE